MLYARFDWLDTTHKVPHTTSKSQALLVLSWQDAFCMKHQRYAECKLIKKGDKAHLTLHGLWPQPRRNQYCHIERKYILKDKHHQWRALPDLNIERKNFTLMKSYMPGYRSMLYKHEWIKHGSCYSNNPNTYFHDALTLAKEVDNSAVGKFFRENQTKTITLKQVRKTFDNAFGSGAGKHVELVCRNGIITELRIHIGSHGDALKSLITKGSYARSRCKYGKVVNFYFK